MAAYAGPIGAALGLAIGIVEYLVVSRIVIGALRRTDGSRTEVERADYERRIRVTRAALLVMMVGFTPLIGFLVGRTLFG